METLSCHSNESISATAIKNIFVEANVIANVMNISKKFQLHPPNGLWGDDFLIYFCKFSLSVAMATNQIKRFGQNSYEHQEQIWPCHKNGQGQPRVIIWKYKAAGQGQTTRGDKILMSTETSCHFGHLLQVSKKSLWGLILYNFFHDYIHVYSPGAGAKIPLGMKFWCQHKHVVTSVSCCKFKKNLFEVWFLQFFSWFYTCI